jgi:hypothetical protein
MGTLSARFMPNRIIGISQQIYMISSRYSVDLEKLPQFGRSNDFKERSPVDERSIVQKKVAKGRCAGSQPKRRFSIPNPPSN